MTTLKKLKENVVAPRDIAANSETLLCTSGQSYKKGSLSLGYPERLCRF